MAQPQDVVSAPFRMQPGLSRLPVGAAHWRALSTEHPLWTEKRAILRDSPQQALVSAPGWDPWPALRALVAQAHAELPEVVQWDGRSLSLPALGLRGDLAEGSALHWAGHPGATLHDVARILSALPPWQAIAGALALVLHEDWAVFTADGMVPLIAACVPSHWDPRQKVGRHFSEIHAPVADNQLLIRAADGLARLVTGSDRWERHVWTVTPLPTHDAHPARVPHRPWPPGASPDDALRHACWRVERQTFLPYDHAGQPAALFTIQVSVRPLLDVLQHRSQADLLHDALASMSPAVLGYRGLHPVRDVLLQGLRTLPLPP